MTDARDVSPEPGRGSLTDARDVSPEPGPPPLVVIDDLRIHFPFRGGIFGRSRVVHAVDGVSLAVYRGETVSIVGESGCGKTTLGRGVLRLYHATGGRITYNGRDLARLSPGELRRQRRHMQMIFQDPMSSLDPHMKIEDIIAEPLDIHHIASGRARSKRVDELMEMVGLKPSLKSRYPREFSGGQRQRIGIARALAPEPEFIVCDEPISSLDVSIQAQILNLLSDLRDRIGLAYLFIAHDLGVVNHFSHRVAVMYLGKIVEVAEPTSLFSIPAHPYTAALLSAVRVPDPMKERTRHRIILDGDVPSPVDPPRGCRFRSRCWLYRKLNMPERCRLEEPQLCNLDSSHAAACHFAADTADAIE